MKKAIILLVVCAVIGFELWYAAFQLDPDRTKFTFAEIPTPVPIQSGSDETFHAEKPSQPESFAYPKIESEESNSVSVHRARGTRSLRNGVVSREIIELLALSLDEVDRLNRLVRKAVDELKELELDRVEVLSSSEQEVVLRIPAHAAEGLKIAEAIYHGVMGIVGEERGMHFMEAMDASISLFWNDFGHFDRILTFSVEPRGSGQYWLEFQQKLPRDQVEAYYGHPVSREVSIWPGFGMLIDVHSTVLEGFSLGRAAAFVPVLPKGMRSLFELMGELSLEESEANQKHLGLD